MQLVITVIGSNHTKFIDQILSAVTDCKCIVIEFRTTRLADSTAGHLLIEGNWNHIAKLENIFENLQTKLELKIHRIRTDTRHANDQLIPYSLETICLDRDSIIQSITAFLGERNITIEEISASRYQAAYTQADVFSTKFIILISPDTSILSFRDEFIDFCDQLNIDAFLEAIKR